ncbi:MAG: hypothetical protein V3W44_10910 [Dehalococcoidales bacterium]
MKSWPHIEMDVLCGVMRTMYRAACEQRDKCESGSRDWAIHAGQVSAFELALKGAETTRAGILEYERKERELQ